MGTDRLHHQRQASTHTIAAYRDAIRLLVVYAAEHTRKAPCAMDSADLDAPLIGAFLTHLEAGRHNSVRSRNARLAAVHSLFRHAALCRPDDAAVIQRVLAIPPKRFDRALVIYLTEEELTALLKHVMNFRHLAHLKNGTRTADFGPISASGPRLLRLAAVRMVHNTL